MKLTISVILVFGLINLAACSSPVTGSLPTSKGSYSTPVLTPTTTTEARNSSNGPRTTTSVSTTPDNHTSLTVSPTLPNTVTANNTAVMTTAARYTVEIASKTGVGHYLIDGRGLALYYTTSDRPYYSNLPDETLTSWPVFYTLDILVPSALTQTDFGIYVRDNGVKQATFKGYPLYHFFQDKNKGDTLGNMLGGVWFLVQPGTPPF